MKSINNVLNNKLIERVKRLSYNETLNLMKFEPSNVDEELEAEIVNGLERFHNIINYKAYEVIYNIEDIDVSRYDILKNKLVDCERVLIGASSLGHEVSNLIVTESNEGNYLLSIMYDLLANYYITQYHCNRINGIRKELVKEGKYLTTEITPGNNADISLQRDVFDYLEISEIILTEDMLMIPVKSLSYIYGITPIENYHETGHNCEECMSLNCHYRNKKYIK